MIGIYCIKNKINNKVYIGQSWHVARRWWTHKNGAEKGKHEHTHLYSSLRKYGIDNFDFTVLRKLPENDLTQILLDCLECHYIHVFDSMNPLKGYNTDTGGLGGRRSEEVKRRISEAVRAGFASGTRKPSYGMLGKKASEATKLKMSEGKKGKKPYEITEEIRKHIGDARRARICPMSEETKKKLSESCKGKNKGKVHTEAQKRKSSESHRGQRAWNKGIPMAENMKKRISQTLKGRSWSDKRRAAYEKRYGDPSKKSEVPPVGVE